jgi:hypothetical protein
MIAASGKNSGATMAIKFLLSADDDLIWDIDDHGVPITEQQAMIVAVRQMAASLGAIAEVLAKPASAAAPKPPAPKAKAKAKPTVKGGAKRRKR